MLNMLKKLFTKEKESPPVDMERTSRDLLRENLNMIPIDVFYADDPLNELPLDQRKLYLKYFYDIVQDGRFTRRLKYLINRQALKTLSDSRSGGEDMAGSFNLNGIASVKDDIERLSNMHLKEQEIDQGMFDRFKIMPE